MVGLRYDLIHNYNEINLEILQTIIENHLVDFLQFTKTILLY